jgi:anthranilate phosphoribosyltransferase
MTTFRDAFEALARNDDLGTAEVRGVFDAILRGQWSPIQVGAFIASLRLRGESAEIIEAAARAMRAAMVRVDHGLPRVLDTCGTGGDGLGTLNLSTGAAVIVAAAGIPVAKHGNRAVSSRCGSADVLAALGIAIDLPPSAAARLLREVGIAFMLAPTHHPAMKYAAEARRELGIRTIFNCLGPLANPALATHQLIGAYDDRLRGVMAETLRGLGTRRAWIVRGEDGLDEVSPCAPTRVTELGEDGVVHEHTVSPEDFGLPWCLPKDIAGGDAAENAAALERILKGHDHPGSVGIFLNAAAALVVAEGSAPRDAAARAIQIVQSGAAAAKLASWRETALRIRDAMGQ